jgi:tRNA uridine 5-carboxymethylaminomethyl modification enzyme
MFTSRAEFRLHLRIDNADRRLTPNGRRLGLINDEAWAEYEQKQARMSALERFLTTGKVDPERLQRAGFGELPATAGLTWAQLLKRPEVTIEPLLAALHDDLTRDPLLVDFISNPSPASEIVSPAEIVSPVSRPAVLAASMPPASQSAHITNCHPERPGAKRTGVEGPVVAFSPADDVTSSAQSFVSGHDFSRAVDEPKSVGALAPARRFSPEVDFSIARSTLRNEARSVETEIKFAGYLEQQKKSIERLKAAESVTIPEWIEYSTISGLSREMRETLERIRPMTIGQASRIPGVTPAALTLVHVSIKLQGKLQGKRQGAERQATA